MCRKIIKQDRYTCKRRTYVSTEYGTLPGLGGIKTHYPVHHSSWWIWDRLEHAWVMKPLGRRDGDALAKAMSQDHRSQLTAINC